MGHIKDDIKNKAKEMELKAFELKGQAKQKKDDMKDGMKKND